MQLIVHAPLGSRINRAWGLALRKRFCRKFDFELQAAATEDAIVLSLASSHSFPLADVAHYLSAKTVRPLLVQALLDAPMFGTRWRWNAGVRAGAAALPRRPQGRTAAAAHGVRGSARLDLSRSGGVRREHRRRPRDTGSSAGAANDRRLPARGDGHRWARARASAISRAGRSRCVARDLTEPSPLALEILCRAAVRLSRRCSARGAPHAGGARAPLDRPRDGEMTWASSTPMRSGACAKKCGPSRAMR